MVARIGLGWLLFLPIHTTGALHLIELSGSNWTVSSSEPVVPDGHGDVLVPAKVPGDVHDDLISAGLLPPLDVGNGSATSGPGGFLWVWRRRWTYRTSFTIPAMNEKLVIGKRWLQFYGADYNVTVMLNGAILGHHVGQFEEFEFEVSRTLHHGTTNLLEVAIEPIPDGMPPNGAAACWMNQHTPQWKARTWYGWDFVPTLWTIGIWKPVYVAAVPDCPGRAKAAVAIPRLAPALQSALVMCKLHVKNLQASLATTEIRIRWTVLLPPSVPGPAPQALVTQHTVPAGVVNEVFWANVTVTEPALWWPNGYGDQPLYKLRAELLSAGGNSCDTVSTAFGIRELHISDNPHLPDWTFTQWGPLCPSRACRADWDGKQIGTPEPLPPNATRWQVTINGVQVFLRGHNWLPRDWMYGRGVREINRTYAILRAAAHAGFTWMRVWGGGLIEDTAFYHACDELGILLLQEMPNAGCAPGGPGDLDPNYTTRLPSEATQISHAIETLASHPSIVRYNYGNEYYLNASVSPLISQFLALARQLDNSRPAHEANPTCIAIRHGPYTFSPAFEGSTSTDGSYATYGALCGNGSVLVPSMPAECGFQGALGSSAAGNPFEWDEWGATGLTDIETINKTIPEMERAVGWQNSISPSWAFHRLSQWGNREGYRAVFSPGAAALPTLQWEIRASQFVQAEGYRYAWQAHRRAKPHRSAACAWTFNEPWPNAAHGSILSFHGTPKMAFYYAREALGMVDVSLHYSSLTLAAGRSLSASGLTLWAESELATQVSCTLKLEYIMAGGSEVVATESRDDVVLAPSAGRQLDTSPGIWLRFAPNKSLQGVLLVRTTLKCAARDSLVHTYTFAIRSALDQTDFGSTSISHNSLPTPPLGNLVHLPQQGSGALVLTVEPRTGSTPMISVRSLSHTPLLFVRLVVRECNASLMPYVLFSVNYFTMLPEETIQHVAITFAMDGQDLACARVCAEAWNTKEVCISLGQQVELV